MTDRERWLPVVGYEGYYEVSDLGHVRSMDRVVLTGTGPRKLLGRVLATWSSDQLPYPQVSLHVQGSRKHRYVHDLVLHAFVGPRPSPKHEALHGIAGSHENSVTNLRWGTSSENNYDTVAHGNHSGANKTHCSNGHLLVQPNLVSCMLPGRTCLACNRARAHIASKTLRKIMLIKYKDLADLKYAKIMKDAA